VIFDEHSKMRCEKCTVDPEFILRLELPLYEDRQTIHLGCITDVARNNTDSVQCFPSTVNRGAQLARTRRHMIDSSLIRNHIDDAFKFERN
jgi:hypothetical protein